MNKNLLAIAMAAAIAAPSIASADVKLIGRAQLEVVSTSGDLNEGLTLDDSYQAGTAGKGNASGFGVKGTHDLGNGLTGIFKVYTSFQPDDGSGGLGKARDMYVGLKGGFGTILAGRIATPYKSSTAKWDPFQATFLQARGNNGRSQLHNGYANDVLAYVNKFGNAKFVGAIALDESQNNNKINGDHITTFSLNMPVADNMELAIAYLDNSAAADGTATKVGLKFKSGDMTISGQYETLGANVSDTKISGASKSLYLNGSMSLGGGSSVSLGFGQLTDDGASGNDGTHTAIGYKTKMSKTVTAYGGVIAINDGVLGKGNSTTQFGGGLRVAF